MSTADHDCEMDIDGKKHGDSERKGYEGCFKCKASTPAQLQYLVSGGHTNGNGTTQIDIGDIEVFGTTTNVGNLRTLAGLGKNTKIKKIVITRLAKIDGKAEDQEIQVMTAKNAYIANYTPNDYDNTFSATIGFEEIEIKDIPIKKDGTAGSPIVNSYNRLTHTANG